MNACPASEARISARSCSIGTSSGSLNADRPAREIGTFARRSLDQVLALQAAIKPVNAGSTG